MSETDRSIRGSIIDYEDENAALRTGYFYRLDQHEGIHILNKYGTEETHVFLFESLNGRKFYCTKKRFSLLTKQKEKFLSET